MNYVVLMESIVKVIAIICGIGLPILIVWLDNRKKINETNQRTQIVLAALEKNPNLDVEELIKKMAPTQKKKLLKEKLLAKLLWGLLATLLGIGFIGCHIYVSLFTNSTSPCGFAGIVLLAVGLAFLVNFYVGKKMLAKEMEEEQMKVMSDK